MKKNIELLAPAGSYEALVAAVNGGCDAVYLGGQRFSARANANNFDDEELKRAIDFAHINDVSLYYTANTIIKENEFEDLFKQTKMLYEAGIDALIIQDIGVYQMLKSYFPDLPIHGSTQMTIHSLEGAKLTEELGFERVVLSRECSIDEIKAISAGTNIDLEIFVHGALCYCYSGQCLMSSIIGGRSGNRGQCAQPCRLFYDTYSGDKRLNKQNEKYILSPKDVMSLKELPAILESGALSLKIEGRMKKPEYVGLVTSLYRKYIDLYFEDKANYRVNDQDIQDILQIYNRGGFTTGYFNKKVNKDMMSLSKPNHFGVQVGKVSVVDKNIVAVKFTEHINKGDYLEAINSKGKTVTLHPNSEISHTGDFKLKDTGLRVNDRVFRLVDKGLNQRVQDEIINQASKINVSCSFMGFIGEEAIIQLSYGEHFIEYRGNKIERAKNRALTKEKIIEQLNKTGNEIIAFEQIDIYGDADIFMPISEINRLRREAIALLKEDLTLGYKRQFNGQAYKKPIKRDKIDEKGISVLVRNRDHFDAVRTYPIRDLYIEFNQMPLNDINFMIKAANDLGINTYLALPRIIDQSGMKKIVGRINKLEAFKGFLVRTYDQFYIVKGLNKDIIIDYTLNVFNSQSLSFWEEHGVSKVALSNEVNKRELARIPHYNSELMIYGYLPVMVSKQCVYKNMGIDCHTKDNHITLKDRRNMEFIVERDCSLCVNTIYNSKPTLLIDKLSEVEATGIDSFRIELLNEDKKDIQMIMEGSFKALEMGRVADGFVDGFNSGFTRGHFNRGVQ